MYRVHVHHGSSARRLQGRGRHRVLDTSGAEVSPSANRRPLVVATSIERCESSR
jgi:hypothetical protein